MALVENKNEATIPFETGNNVVYVPGKSVDVHMGFCWIAAVLTPETTTAIGVRVTGHRNSHLGAGSNAHMVGFASIKRMILGGVVALDNQRVHVKALPGTSKNLWERLQPLHLHGYGKKPTHDAKAPPDGRLG